MEVAGKAVPDEGEIFPTELVILLAPEGVGDAQLAGGLLGFPVEPVDEPAEGEIELLGRQEVYLRRIGIGGAGTTGAYGQVKDLGHLVSGGAACAGIGHSQRGGNAVWGQKKVAGLIPELVVKPQGEFIVCADHGLQCGLPVFTPAVARAVVCGGQEGKEDDCACDSYHLAYLFSVPGTIAFTQETAGCAAWFGSIPEPARYGWLAPGCAGIRFLCCVVIMSRCSVTC